MRVLLAVLLVFLAGSAWARDLRIGHLSLMEDPRYVTDWGYARQIENFAGMMNFVIFPMFFLSSALYPLWKLREAGVQVIYYVANWNPFSHAVELVRFAAYGEFNLTAFLVVAGTGIAAFVLAVRGYNPLIGAFGQVKRD